MSSIARALATIIFIALSRCRGAWALDVVLLGDSYASGNGGGSYSGGSCYRSANAWGKQAADNLGATNFVNNACSGSEVSALSSQDSVVDSSTNVVLVGTGGNDLFFEDVVTQCFAPFYRDKPTCQSFISQASNGLSALQDDLVDALVAIESQLPSFGIAVLVGYPYITLDTDYTTNCCGFTSPNSDIISALRSLGNDVDSNQQAAVSRANSQAGRTFAYFYGTKSLFSGHEPDPDFGVSNPDGWINEFDGSSFEYFHLNQRGHSELGAALAPFVQSRLPATPAPVTTPEPTDAPVATPAPTTKEPTPAPVAGPTPPTPFPTQGTPGSSTPFPSRMPSPTPPAGGDDNGGGGINLCFSGDATVHVKHRAEPVRMKDLSIGDMVLTRNQVYEPIYAFGHRHVSRPTSFLQLSTTSTSRPLEMTSEHMVFIEGRSEPLRAGSIQVGDVLQKVSVGSGSPITTAGRVIGVTVIERKGLYAPLTPSGTIVVDGVLASTYVAVQQGNEHVQLGYNNSQQVATLSWLHQADAVHMWLSPLRLACGVISNKFCAIDFHNRETGMHRYVEFGLDFVAWGQTQSILLQVFLLLLGLSIFGASWIVEMLLNSSHLHLFCLVASMLVLRTGSYFSVGLNKKASIHAQMSNPTLS